MLGSRRLNPYLLLTIAPLLWAGNIVLARGISTVAPPVALSFWRWALAVLIALPLTWGHARRDWPVASRQLPWLALLGLLGVSSFSTLLYMAVRTTTAVNGSLMQTALPGLVVLLSFLVYGTRITPLQGVAVAAAVGGALILVTRGDWETVRRLQFVPGDLLILLAVALYALYSVLLRRPTGLHPSSLLAYTFVLGTLLIAPFYLLERQGGARLPLTPTTAVSILYLAVGPSLLAYWCWNSGVAALGPNRAGLFINLLPVFAALLAVLFLGETLHLYHLVGMLLIGGGVALFNRSNTAG